MPNCLECTKQFKSITNTHVEKFHSITLAEYQKKYPDSPIRDAGVIERMYRNASETMSRLRKSGVIVPKPMSEERRKWHSDRMRDKNPMKNKETVEKQRNTLKLNKKPIAPRSEEARKRYSESKKGDKNPMKNPETAVKNAKAHSRKKSGIEKFFDEIVAEYQLPFRYVGNNKLWIGNKNPDYECTDPAEKLVIEVTSNAYHRLENNYEPDRIAHFNTHGYRAMTVRFTNCQKAYKQKLKGEIASLLKLFIHEKNSYQIYHSVTGQASSIQL